MSRAVGRACMGARTAARTVAALFVTALLASVVPAHAAGDAAGTAAGSFLSVGSGASVLSMSGATLASGRDLAAASWNVASLAQVDALEFALSHAPLPGGATQDWFAAGGRFGAGSTRWAVNALFHQEGALEGRDAANQPTGSLAVSDLALGARVARPLGEHLSAGFGAEWVHESLAGTNGSGLAFDAGVRAQAGAFGAALAARHLGGSMNYGGTRYDLPGVIAAGVSWADEARGLRVAADLESPTHYYRGLRLGGEWRVRDWMAVRAGYRRQMGEPSTEQLSGASFGLGTGVGNLWMDYAYSPEGGEGAGQHRLGLTFRPGHANASGANAHTTRPQVEPPARKVREPAAEKVAAPKPAPREAAPTMVEPERASARTSEPAKPTPVATPAAVPAPPAPSAVAPPVSNTPEPASAPAAVAPPSTPPSAPPSAPEVKAAPVIVRPTAVIVAPGETMLTIARRWDTTVPALMMANDLVREQVQPGMRLKLPPARKH